jgi:purine-binding chemotaxis protein CheW
MTAAMAPQDDRLTVVTITLGRQAVAIPAASIREILDPLPVTRVPRAPRLVPGVLNVRGAVVPLADLHHALGLPAVAADGTRRRIVVLDVEIEDEIATVAFAADAVHEVAVLSAREIEPAPATTIWPPGTVKGLSRRDEGFVLIPDLPAILAGRPAGRSPV